MKQNIRLVSITFADTKVLQGFMLKKKSFGQQYSQIYNNRLNLLRPVLLEKCSKSKMNIVPKIIDLETNVECVIIGTVYKEMLCKPCVLDEITEEVGVVFTLHGNNNV